MDFYSGLVQLAERKTVNFDVPGSSPGTGAIQRCLIDMT